MGEVERGQVVDGEAELVPVHRERPSRTVLVTGSDAGVVDQHVDPVGELGDLPGERPDLGQAGEVGEDRRRVGSTGRCHLVAEGRQGLGASPVQDQSVPVRGQGQGHLPPESVGRAGDDDGLRGHGHDRTPSVSVPAGSLRG